MQNAGLYGRRDPERHKATMRKGNYRRQYGIVVEDYDRLYVAQGGRCAICGSVVPGGCFTHFAVDHDHHTGKIRGLLCTACNRALGLFHDNPVTLELAAQYLRNHF